MFGDVVDMEEAQELDSSPSPSSSCLDRDDTTMLYCLFKLVTAPNIVIGAARGALATARACCWIPVLSAMDSRR